MVQCSSISSRQESSKRMMISYDIMAWDDDQGRRGCLTGSGRLSCIDALCHDNINSRTAPEEGCRVASRDEPRSPSSALLQMAQAYRQSAILMTACELRVFTFLSQVPMRAEALARHCQVPVRGLQRLLNACVVLDLLEKADERYHNTPIAETFLVQGKSGYMGNFIRAGAEQYEAWGHLTRAIQEDRPIQSQAGEALPTLPGDRIRGYVARLYELGKHNAVAIADRLDLENVQQMLDVAGGSGIYSITFAQRQPSLRASVFDLPPIIAFAQEIIADHGMLDRVTVHPGNYFLDDF